MDTGLNTSTILNPYNALKHHRQENTCNRSNRASIRLQTGYTGKTQDSMNTPNQPTFLFHDYETFGVDPRRDRPVQFAAIRTDAEFNPIGKPIELFAQLSPDYLPAPDACLITGITPQIAQQRGMPECEFMRKIHQYMSEPGTCTLGYNSIRFDDEVTRYTCYRNFIDPYAWSWQHGNSRWDLLDVIRACHALRPEGIEWPENDEGFTSFKLEHLSVANGIEHSNAHDAMADVIATIELAKKTLARAGADGRAVFLLGSTSRRAAESCDTVDHWSGNAEQQTINLAHLPNGVYFMVSELGLAEKISIQR